ncbi:MAG: DDE-type integrase/transposase/recombinase [Nitrospinae bacterium]|nr:DDE-type integrase/transposase/recombinase [Nitrospinota bacterium]
MKISATTAKQIAEGRAAHSGPLGDYVARCAEVYRVSVKTIYRILNAHGKGSGRTRAKRGSAISDETAKRCFALLSASRRRNNQVLGATPDAVRILEQNGLAVGGMSAGAWNRRLRELGLTARGLKAEKAYRPIYTDHPNELWLTDATPCVMYFLADGGAVRANRDFTIEVSRKPEDMRKVREHLIRYAMVDHTSGAFFFQYVYAAGENTNDVMNFIYQAMAAKDDSRFPFRGVPRFLWTDPGSAFKNAIITNLCENLDVTLTHHLPGNPRAKGAVETINNWLTRWFEAWLALKTPASLVQLNAWAFDFCVWKNAQNCFRGSLARTALWMTITQEQLRECPPKEIFGRLAATEPVRRRISPNLQISFGGKMYRLPNDPALNGQEAFVRLNAYDFGKAEVIVWRGTEKETRFALAPIEKDIYGRTIDVETAQRPGAPKAIKDGAVETGKKEAEKFLAGYGVEFKGTGSHRRALPAKEHSGARLKVFGEMAENLPDVALIPRKGTEHPATAQAAAEPATVYPLISAMEIIMGEMGRDRLYAAENDHLHAMYPAGMTEADIRQAVALFTRQDGGEKVVTLRPAVNE